MHIKKSPAERIFEIGNYALMLFFAVIMLYPFWDTLVVSVSPATEAATPGLRLFTTRPTLEAYQLALSSKLIGYGYLNSVLRTVISTVISVFLCFCTAYPLAKKYLPARSAITFFYLIPMFFGGGLIPTFLLVKSLGLYNSFWALVLPSLLGTYNILIMRNFIMALPESLEESAFLDGAGFFTILIKIIIPLSTPIMATIALWVAVFNWNEWFDAMIYTSSDKLMVLQLILRRTIIEDNNSSMAEISGNEGVITRSIQAATVLIAIGPIIVTYPFAQKYFVKGIMVGSLKG